MRGEDRASSRSGVALRSRILVSLLLVILGGAGATLALAAVQDSTGMDWSEVPAYRIVPGDVLRFNFGPSATALGDVIREGRVRPDGRVSVFPVGEVIAAGRTVTDLQQAVVQMMSAEYRFPRVSVEVFELAGNRVHVLGQVNQPGSYNALPFMTVSQAIAAAGGFAADASRNSVLVFHRDGARNLRVERLRLDRSLKRADLDEDPLVSRFAIIYVPRSPIGNLQVFSTQFFGSMGTALSASLTGWELFHLDRVFIVK